MELVVFHVEHWVRPGVDADLPVCDPARDAARSPGQNSLRRRASESVARRGGTWTYVVFHVEHRVRPGVDADLLVCDRGVE
jgi:hypothetical protein